MTEPNTQTGAASEGSSRRQRGDANRALKRDQILSVAAQLFAEHGYRGVTMDQLADQFDFTKPALYYYVGSKDELAATLVSIATERTRELIAAVSEMEDPRERLQALIEGTVERATGETRLVYSVLDRDTEMPTVDPEVLDARQKMARSWLLTWIAAVKDAIKEGYLPDADPVAIALGLIGMCSWCAKWYKRDYQIEADAISSAFTKLILRDPPELSP